MRARAWTWTTWMARGRAWRLVGCLGGATLALTGCGDDKPAPTTSKPTTTTTTTTTSSLLNRAYIVARDSDDVTVIDLGSMEIIGRMKTGGIEDHMADLNADFTKLYVDSPGTNETVVVDVASLQITKRIPVGQFPTHLSLTPSGIFAVMDEYGGTVSFIDTERDVEVKRLPGFYTPHFMRMAPDGRYGYVANIGASHISRVDLEIMEIDMQIPLEGTEVPTEVEKETGFADVQIDRFGILYGAHSATGRVMVFDTNTATKVRETQVGSAPWIVYANHPFANVPMRYLVPNFGDQTVSMLAGESPQVLATMPGDQESFGVNYTSKAPEKAFVMNRIRKDISVVDTNQGTIVDRIDVGGNTETASTTPDGSLIVAAVSGADKIVVIDAVTNRIIKTFDGVGKYPWSVTIPNGQNYCH
jgi:YVTN family beta-propeller protein